SVIFTDDISASVAYMAIRDNFNFPHGRVDECSGCHFAHGSSSYIVLDNKVGAGQIAHEAWHCVHALLKWVGAQKEDEVVAYHLGYIVDKVTHFRREGVKKH